MKVGAATSYGLLSKSALEACKELQRNGIDVIELWGEYRHTLISEKDIIALRKAGLDFSVHLPFSNLCFAHMNPEVRDPQVRMIKKYLAIAEKLGATHCVMHGGFIPDFYLKLDLPVKRQHFLYLFVKEFGKMFGDSSESGMKIVIENLGFPAQIGAIYEDIVYLKEKIHCLGFCFDPSHAQMQKDDIARYLKMRIDHVHITDTSPGNDDHLAVGKGSLPIRDIMGKLKMSGYKGKVIFEGLTLKDTLESVPKLREMVK